MKRFLITAPTYTGEIVVVYDNDILIVLDLSQIEPRTKFAKNLFQQMPRYYHTVHSEGEKPLLGFQDWINSKRKDGVVAIQEDVEIDFDMFWEAYAKKINKKRCEPLWRKLSKDKRIKALYGIKTYDRFLATSYRNKADPENYLRNEMWENEWK